MLTFLAENAPNFLVYFGLPDFKSVIILAIWVRLSKKTNSDVNQTAQYKSVLRFSETS